MIIRSPTGFYLASLPQKPSDVGNITYTISTQDPPRPQLLFTKIPIALGIRQAPPLVYTDDERAAAVSNLAHSTSKSTPSQLGTTTKQFEIGEFIDFGVTGNVPTIKPMLVNDVADVRHDTNILDLTNLGVSDDEQDVVTKSSNAAFKTLSAKLTLTVQARTDTETQLSSNQKLLNETNKALNAIAVLIASGDGTGGTDPDLDTVRIKLVQKKANLENQKTVLVAQANSLAADAETLQANLLQLSQLVR